MTCAQLKPTRPASFRGLAFHVDDIDESGGFRKPVHEYPNRDQHYVEDLGHSPDSFSVNGYIHDIDAQGNAIRELREVLKRHGPGTFYDPLIDELFDIEIKSWSISRSKDQQNRIDFSLSAVRVDSRTEISPLRIETGTASLADTRQTLQQTLDSYYRSVTSQALIEPTWQQALELIELVQSLYFQADRGNYRGVLNTAAAAWNVLPGNDVIDGIFTVIDALQQDSDDEITTWNLFSTLSDSQIEAASGTSSLVTLDNQHIAAVNDGITAASFYQLAQTVINSDYQDAATANQQRFEFAQIGLKLQKTATTSNKLGLYESLSSIISAVGDSFSDYTDQLRPVDTLELQTPLTSLAIAWNLYQDASMAADLLARNPAFNASFMPKKIEYLVINNQRGSLGSYSSQTRQLLSP